MNIGLTSTQEIAAEQLRTIAPLIQLSRKSFVALNALAKDVGIGWFEPTAKNCSLALAKAVLVLKHELRRVIAGQ